MKLRARADANQQSIFDALRAVGASVADTHNVGNGVPDCFVLFRGTIFAVEIKNPKQPPSKRRLTPDEAEFRTKWRNVYHIVTTPEQALGVIGATREAQRNP